MRSQVLNLMRDLQEEMHLTYLFISHDLSVIKHISDRIVVMYLGRVVEVAEKHELLDNALHPYTQALISAIPKPVVGAQEKRIVLTGDIPSPIAPPSGCPFHPRCPHCEDVCKRELPAVRDAGGGHLVACHRIQENPGVNPRQEIKGRKDHYAYTQKAGSPGSGSAADARRRRRGQRGSRREGRHAGHPHGLDDPSTRSSPWTAAPTSSMA